MNIPVRRVSSGVVLLALFFLFSGCNTNKNAEETTELLYRQAYTSSSSRDYLKALDYFNKALVLDTLQGVTPRVVRGLFDKRFIEGLTGKYDEAFKSTMRLEKLPSGVLPDSLRNAVLSDKATWLHELGNPSAAVASLEKIASPSPEISFKLASFYLESGDFSKAAMIYRNFAGREIDPVTRIKAYAGLLQCKIARPQLGIEEADALAGKIAAESGRVLAIKGDLIPRIQALRAASRSLLLLEKHRRNASYLLFRALILAEESGNQFILQVLRLESNAAIVRKADTFREVADYFRSRNMQYAQAASLFMLAGSKSLEADERIAALQEGFSISRDYAPPYPTSELLQLEKSSGRRLTGLLIEKSRIFELFDAGEKIGMIDLQRTLQRYPGSIMLGKGHEALESEVRRLQYEISGLLQRKADIFIRAEGDDKSRPVDQALNIKRGKMLELLMEVRAVNPVAAEAMQLLPVTLRTVQGALKEDQVILKPLLSDSLCGVMLISKRQLQIAGSALSFDSLHTPESGIRALRSELAAAKTGEQLSGNEQAWFDTAFYEPLAGSLNGFRHLVVIADDLLPYHLLGSSRFSFPQQRYSFLQSIKEFVLLSENSGQQPASSQVYFYRVENISGARVHKLFFPSDRVFLLWKEYGGVNLEAFRQQIAQEMQGTVSGSAALLVLGKASDAGRETWKYISSYGAE